MRKTLLVLLVLLVLAVATYVCGGCQAECRSNADCAPGDYCADTWVVEREGSHAARYCLSIDAGATSDAGGEQ